MGWRNQHDFKIKFGVSFLSLLLLTGCTFQHKQEEFNYDSVSGQESETVKIENDGPAYFVTWNTAYKYIDVNDALVVKTKARRTVEDEVISYESKVINPNTYIDNRNIEILNSLTAKKTREAEEEKLEVKKITAQPGDEKEVWLWGVKEDSKGNSKDYYYSDTAVCKYAGKHCVVWYVANKDVTITDKDCENLGKKFDTIYELETGLVGSNIYETTPYYDVINPQDKIELVFTDLWQDKVLNNTIIGYQSTADGIKQEYYEKYCTDEQNNKVYDPSENGHSNESQLIYIDTYIFTVLPDTVYSTLVHEFNHLLNFCQKSLLKGIGIETWYTEMLAMLAEDAFQKYLNISDIDSSKARLLDYMTPKGYTTSPFSNYQITGNVENVIYCYASTYALGAYLVRNFGGLKLMHEIATNDYGDRQSIDNALIKTGYDFDFEYESLKNYNPIFFYEPYILINIDAKDNENLSTINKPGYDSYYTLNRTWIDSSFPDLSFDAISLVGKYEYKNKEGDTLFYFYEPEYMNPELAYKGYVYNCAFTIWKLGKNLSSVKIETKDRFVREGFWQIIYPQQQ